MKRTAKKGDDARTLSIRMPDDMREQLEREAAKKTLPLTLFIRMLLKEWLDKNQAMSSMHIA